MPTFISYSRDNSSFVVRLAKDLKAAGFDVWLDQLDIPKGTRWDDEIEAAVEKSSTFMIVLAPESIESQNVKDELSYAIDTGKHILPVIIKPCKLPLRLRRFQHVDFTDKPYKESLAEIKRLLSDTKQIPKGAGEQNKLPGGLNSIPAAFKEHKTQPIPTTHPTSPPINVGSVKNRSSKVIMPAVILVVLGMAAAAVFMATSGSGIFSSSAITSTATVTPELPAATQPAPTTAPATAVIPVTGQFYTEDFDEMFDWTQVMIKGVEKQVSATTTDGSLAIELSFYQDQEPYVLFVNEDHKYKDVQVEAAVTNNGINDNKTILACRIGDTGWYAFEISNGGTYSIKAFDTTGKFAEGFKELTNGGSPAIKFGKVTNVYRAICEGSDLTLEVNGTTVATVDETKFNLTSTEGPIGIGADSPSKNYPVSLLFDSVMVSEP